MDQPPNEPSIPEPKPAAAPEIRVASPPSEPLVPPRTGTSRIGLLLGIAGVLMGVAALAGVAWTYADTRREVVRLATDVAQLRISLDLYQQRSQPEPQVSAAEPDNSAAQLDDLANRLAILEQSWRSPAVAIPATPAPTTSVSAGDQDCLPPGMRILVAAGDTYPICGTDGSLEVASVDNGFVALRDGTTVPSGGSVGLPNTVCMIGVTSGGDEGLTGYAEIRVTC